MQNTKKRVLLCILDGWGISNDTKYNSIYKANTQNYDRLLKTMPNTILHADGLSVGLPEGQMGNSEVGHLNIGAGRVVYQELTRINKAIDDGDFFKNQEFLNAINHVKKNNSAVHIYGLLSNGGVHSATKHLKALIKMMAQNDLKEVYLHAFLDGRDTPPSSAIDYLKDIEAELEKYNLPKVASIIGRYWAMDRDKRWDRVERAYDCLTLDNPSFDNSIDAIESSYKNNVTDEFVEPVAISPRRINSGDAVIFFNFRPDRAREITRAFNEADFDGFKRKKIINNLYYVCMTQYDETFSVPVAFRPQTLKNILGDVLDENNIKQFRTAETEKYAHITFFFNGGVEKSGRLEQRALVNSPSVATYDLQPEMSAPKVCDNVLHALDDEEYQFILVNFANPDMVGHTGIIEASIKACEAVDECVGKIAKKALKNNVVMIITADHGNAETMFNPDTNTPHTAHTTNPVPFIVVSNDRVELRTEGVLADIAPSVLDIFGIKKPDEMTGKSMIKAFAMNK